MPLRDPALHSWGCAQQYNRWVLLSLFITDAVPGPHVSLLSGRTGISRVTLSPGFIDCIGCGRQSLLFYSLLPDSGRPSLLVPTRTPSQPLSTQGPGGSCTVRCPGDSSSPSSHTNPKSTARSPFIEVTESKVSLCLLLLGKAGPLCLRETRW